MGGSYALSAQQLKCAAVVLALTAASACVAQDDVDLGDAGAVPSPDGGGPGDAGSPSDAGSPMDGGPMDGDSFSTENTSIARIDFSPQGLQIRYLNRVEHLPPELVT